MMTDSKHLVWDTCVFGRYLTADPSDYVDDIQSFIADAGRGTRTIYYSSAVLAEIGRPLLKSGREMDILQFSQSLGSNFVLVDANVHIMTLAGELHAEHPTNPNPGTESNRVIGLGDAIHLATALYVQELLPGESIAFHTLDRGRGKGWEAKCVPLIGLERWFPEASRSRNMKRVCDLARTEPFYPQYSIDFSAVQVGPSGPGIRH